MTVTHDFLVEIGTEELPPGRGLEYAFYTNVDNGLKDSDAVEMSEQTQVLSYATPRRLAVQVLGLRGTERKNTELKEVKGPPLVLAYDESGIPSRAGAGFAKKQGFAKIPAREKLPELSSSDKPTKKSSHLARRGDYLVAFKKAERAKLEDVLLDVVRDALKGLLAERTMLDKLNEIIDFLKSAKGTIPDSDKLDEIIQSLGSVKRIMPDSDNLDEIIRTLKSAKGTTLDSNKLACSLDIEKRAMLDSLAGAKRTMRWGDGDEEFSRPVHWAVLLLDDKIIEADILGVTAGRTTKGHRFMAPGEIELAHAGEYKVRLLEEGKVIADFNDRENEVVKQVTKSVQEAGGAYASVGNTKALAGKVTELTEWPQALKGSFARRFLKLPDIVLTTVMEHHQRYFPVFVQGRDRTLLPHFVFIANIDSASPEKIIAGNQRVLRARLEDALFFFEKDREQPLEEYRNALKDMVFHEGLGTLHDKAERIEELAVALAQALNAQALNAQALNIDENTTRRAAQLAKADLITQMVQELPELQGVMGAEYARLDNEPEDAAIAIGEHYLARSSMDNFPKTDIGAVLALADKMDTLVGFIGAGVKISSSSDPFGLRRTAEGILLILEKQQREQQHRREWDLDLREWLFLAYKGYGALLPRNRKRKERAEDIETALDLIMGRMVWTYIPPIIEAVRARKPASPQDAHKRATAVQGFRRTSEAKGLAAAHKRASNILRKQADEEKIPKKIKPSLLKEPAEKDLAAMLEQKKEYTADLLQKKEYGTILESLAELSPQVDAFFDKVLVMDNDLAIRNNRLALLRDLRDLFCQVADISKLAVLWESDYWSDS